MFEEIKNLLSKDNAAIKIGFVSIISLLIISILNSFSSLDISSFLILESSLWIRFWTIFTYPLVNYSIFSIISELFFIYILERLFRTFFNSQTFWKFFFFGIFFTGIVFLILGFIFPYRELILYGYSAGSFSILFALIRYQPKMELNLFLTNIRINLYTLGMIILSLFTIIPLFLYENKGIYLGQIFGALFGYFYMSKFEQGKDILNLDYWYGIFKKEQKPKTNMDSKNESQLNKILDKISKSGYESLDKNEKEFLFKYNKK